jgi:L-2-hydroxyglutarate oxidase
MADAFTYPGLWRFIRRYPSMAFYEIARSVLKPLFVRSLRAMVPDLDLSDLEPGGAGVRAQAMTADGTLVQDFAFEEQPGALHVLNAPSPAATASLAIGEHVASIVEARTLR